MHLLKLALIVVVGPIIALCDIVGWNFLAQSLENLQQLTTVPTIATEAQLIGDKNRCLRRLQKLVSYGL